jgi:hypothetical protein
VTIRVSPKITGNREQLARVIYESGWRRANSAAGRLQVVAERNMRQVISERFVTDRPTHRRRYPGSPRLVNSFEAVVEGPRNRFPITVRIQPIARVRNNPELMKKTLSLIFGSKPHKIAPTRGFLRFPWSGYRGRTALGSAKRTLEAYGVPNTRMARPVMHPGTRREDVLEEAMRRSVAELRQRRV